MAELNIIYSPYGDDFIIAAIPYKVLFYSEVDASRISEDSFFNSIPTTLIRLVTRAAWVLISPRLTNEQLAPFSQGYSASITSFEDGVVTFRFIPVARMN